MIKHRKRILFVFLFLMILASCKPLQDADSNSVMDKPVVEFTPEPIFTNTPKPPTPTATSTLTPTTSPTMTPTLDALAIELVSYDFVYEKNSSYVLDLHYSSGEYYGKGLVENGSIIDYGCTFRDDRPTRLICYGRAVPFDNTVLFQLYSKESDEMLYDQLFLNYYALHGEIIATPTGMNCEVEPQWDGQGPAHQLGRGCFAMSCWQNGAYFWGTDNTCRDTWPFEWDFTHPLNTPAP